MPDEETLERDLASMMDIYKEAAEFYLQFTGNNYDQDWLPSLSDYNPGISKKQWFSLLNDSTVFTEEHRFAEG